MFRFNVTPKYGIIYNNNKRTIRSSISESTGSVEYSSISSAFDYYISGINSLSTNDEHLIISDSKFESVNYQIVAYPNKNFKILSVTVTVASFFLFGLKFLRK